MAENTKVARPTEISPLQRPGGDAADDVLLEEHVHDQDRECDQHEAGEEHTEIRVVLRRHREGFRSQGATQPR